MVVKGFPRLSETFILQELLALEAAGFTLTIYALKGAREEVTQEEVKRLGARIFYQDAKWSFDSEEQVSLCLERVPHFDLVYAHFLHHPAQFALKVAAKKNKKLVVSGHAVDIYTTPHHKLLPVLEKASKIFVCHSHGASYLSQNFSKLKSKIHYIPHGIESGKFDLGKTKRDWHHFLTVGRLVPKKGYAIILNTLSKLDFDFKYSIIGEGELREELEDLTKRLNILDRVHFLGALTQSEIKNYYQAAGLFLLAPQICDNGDRDGMANVILEAMASGLPVLCGEFDSLSEILISGQTSRVFDGSEEHLAKEISEFMREPESKREARAEMAQELICNRFDSQLHLPKIISCIRQELS